MKRRIRSSIPRRAKEKIYRDDATGRNSLDYYLNGKLVGRRYWHLNGVLVWEMAFRDRRPFGTAREWHPNGCLRWEEHYREGLAHGITRQWNDEGELIASCRMRMGTGVDLYWGCNTPYPSEERHLLKGRRHGFERWWLTRNIVHDEMHFHNGREHGVFRKWKSGKLERGYPKFYVLGNKVTKQQYISSTKRDSTLPPYDAREDSPRRKPLQLRQSSYSHSMVPGGL